RPATFRSSDCDVSAARALGHDELLARDDRRRGQVVPLLQLPHALAWVAGVHPLGDRPQRVAWLDGVGALRPRAARAVGREPDYEGQRADQDEELGEHLFAWYTNSCSVVKGLLRARRRRAWRPRNAPDRQPATRSRSPLPRLRRARPRHPAPTC